MRQSFASWYSVRFEDYITGEKEISPDEIKQDIARLFDLTDSTPAQAPVRAPLEAATAAESLVLAAKERAAKSS